MLSPPAPETAPAAAPEREAAIADVRRRWPTIEIDVIVICGYLLVALWVMHVFWRDPAHLYPETNTSDPEFFEWALVHATRIFTHGENPFFTPQLNAPLGVSMIANTGLLGLTVPLVPVTLLFGPSVSLALIITLGLAATATAWYFVISRYVTRTRLAAVVGGLFCGFGPGMVNHANAHPNIVAQFLIPLIIFRVLALGSPSRVPLWRRGVVLGLLVTWQAFLNEELLFLTALAMLLFLGGYLVSRPLWVREGLRGGLAGLRGIVRPFLIGGAIAVGTAVVLLAYPLWFQFFGPQHYRGLPDFVLGYGSDLASYPAFAKLSLMHGDGSLANQPEENSFLGWPLLVILPVIVAWLWRRRPAVRALSLVAVVFAALSLGPTVNYRGHAVIEHGPWSWINKLPLFDTVVPTRLALVVIPVVGLLLAMCVEEAAALSTVGRFVWTAVLVAVLVPIAPRPLPVTGRLPVPAFIASGAWRGYVRPGQAVLSANTLVWNGGIESMHWGDVANQGYRVVGGYFLGPEWTGKGLYGPQYRATADLLSNVAYSGQVPQIGDEQRAHLAEDARYWNLAIIVLAPTAPHAQALYAALNDLAGPGIAVQDVWIWKLNS
jgi:hypothetical protein